MSLSLSFSTHHAIYQASIMDDRKPLANFRRLGVYDIGCRDEIRARINTIRATKQAMELPSDKRRGLGELTAKLESKKAELFRFLQEWGQLANPSNPTTSVHPKQKITLIDNTRTIIRQIHNAVEKARRTKDGSDLLPAIMRLKAEMGIDDVDYDANVMWKLAAVESSKPRLHHSTSYR